MVSFEIVNVYISLVFQNRHTHRVQNAFKNCLSVISTSLAVKKISFCFNEPQFPVNIGVFRSEILQQRMSK